MRSRRPADDVPERGALVVGGEVPARYLEQPKVTSPAEHTGGNAEDCPVCRPLIDQPGGVLYPWTCTDQPKET